MTYYQTIIQHLDITGKFAESYITVPTREYDLSVHGLGEMSDLSSVSENNQKQLLSPQTYDFLRIETFEEMKEK